MCDTLTTTGSHHDRLLCASDRSGRTSSVGPVGSVLPLDETSARMGRAPEVKSANAVAKLDLSQDVATATWVGRGTRAVPSSRENRREERTVVDARSSPRNEVVIAETDTTV